MENSISHIQDKIKSMARILEKSVLTISCTILVALGLVTCVDVIGRYFFDAPLKGSIEITEMLLVSTFFTAFPIVTCKRQHIVINILDSHLSDTFKHAVNLFSQIMICLLVFIVAYSTEKTEAKALRYNLVTEYFEIPQVYIIYLVQYSLYITGFLMIVLVIKTITHGSEDTVNDDYFK